MYGVEIADRFLFHCQASMRAYWAYDPFWDLMTFIELLPGPPSVYPPWPDFGLPHLTAALMAERNEHYLVSLLNRCDQQW